MRAALWGCVACCVFYLVLRRHECLLAAHPLTLGTTLMRSCYLPALLASVAVPPLAAQRPDGRIAVGPNVMISADRPAQEHGEAVICASSSDPNLLVAAAASATNGKPIYAYGENSGEIVYFSRDGGRTWHYALDTFHAGVISPDAACAFGPDGSAHFSTMLAYKFTPQHIDLDLRLLDYRSADGGKTWDAPVELNGARGADREFTVFDNSRSKYRGRYYMSYDGSFDQRTIENERIPGVFGLSRSLDGGRTWDLPATRASTNQFHNGNLVVLSDGTVLCVLGTATKPPANPTPGQRYPAANVHVVASTDGGETLSLATVVSDMYFLPTSGVHRINAIAVDASSAFKDRAYVVWNDDRSGRMQILSSYSADRGKTWSVPRVVNDDPPLDPTKIAKGPDATAPWVAVNRDGVVGVVWLDRRNVSNNVGYRVRFSASLDGGETWLPSVNVADAPQIPRAVWSVAPRQYSEKPNLDTISLGLGWANWDFTGGDATSIDADAAGNFHPVWVDARTGVRHIWTASVRVAGQVLASRSITRDSLVAVTKALQVDVAPETYAYDSIAGTVSVDVRLRNKGTSRLSAPLVVRVMNISSRVVGELRVANSDNGESSRGAEWDFSGLVPQGGLAPGQETGVKRLKLQLIGPRTFDPPKMTVTGFANLSLEVLGESGGSRVAESDGSVTLAAAQLQNGPRVLVATSMGNFEADVDTVHAPITAGNFLRYVDGRFFDGGSFGRTVRADNQPADSVRIAVIQASIARGRSQEQFPPIELERTKDTGLRHVDGALSMGRTTPNTARSSFFVCVGDQPALDFGGHRNIDGQGFGAFGRVVSGMDVVRRINTAPATGQNLTPPVRIDSIVRVRQERQ